VNQNQNQETNQMNSLLDTEYDKLEELKNEITSEGNQVETETKKKRGRKPKSETIVTPEIPEIDITPILNIVIKRLPNPIPLSESEKTLFNQTSNKVFQKYGGGIKYIEEINLGLVLLSILYPRIQKEQKQQDEIS